jgi:transposase-like protein
MQPQNHRVDSLRFHYHRNLLTRVPKSAQPWVSTLVRTIFEQPDPASVRAQHAQVTAALEAKLPQAAAHLDGAREDILAYPPSPARSGARSGPTTRRSG